MNIIRVFRRVPKGRLRHGMWIMNTSSNHKGDFVHGDRDETQHVRYTLPELIAMSENYLIGGPRFLDIEEIGLVQCLKELENWPEARDHYERYFIRKGAMLDGDAMMT